MTIDTDQRRIELIRRARLGDEDALGDLVDAHSASLIGYIARLTGDYHQSEDLAQETFIRAFDHLDSFDPTREFRPWLYKIGRNLAINYLAGRTSRERRTTDDIELHIELGTTKGPEHEYDRTARRDSIEKVLNMLPVHFREILHLRYLEGFTYNAIAGELNLPMGTVKTWLFRAKEAFLSEAIKAGIEFSTGSN